MVDEQPEIKTNVRIDCDKVYKNKVTKMLIYLQDIAQCTLETPQFSYYFTRFLFRGKSCFYSTVSLLTLYN